MRTYGQAKERSNLEVSTPLCAHRTYPSCPCKCIPLPGHGHATSAIPSLLVMRQMLSCWHKTVYMTANTIVLPLA